MATITLRELGYPANWLSLLRLLLVPAARAAVRNHDKQRALTLTAVAMGTDALDGWLARRRHEISNLGKLIDPIADKLLIDMLALELARSGEIPRWLPRLLMLRDAAILSGGVVLLRRHDHIAASMQLGKLSTALLTAALLLCLAGYQHLGRAVAYVTLVPVLLSLVQYWWLFIKMLLHHPKAERGDRA